MRLFNRIAIIGVGLMGGSIGLAIKKKRLAREVIGVFRRPATMRKALRRRAVDRAVMSVKDGVKNADLIVLATPVGSIPVIAGEAIKFAKKGAIITDVGSTKGWILREVENLLKGSKRVSFVGSHPMAGSERTGVDSAVSGLLEGSPCIVTKTGRTDRKALEKTVRFWKALGAEVKVMSPRRHDEAVSLVSHLPHFVAFSLAGAVPIRDIAYAAEGFKDTTRVAASDPGLWADIFLTNKKEVLKAAGLFEKFYRDILRCLKDNDGKSLIKLLRSAKAKRDRIIHGSKG